MVTSGMVSQFAGGLFRELTDKIIGAAIEVHRAMGPGLLESTYEECLARELQQRQLSVSRQVAVPLMYKEKPLGSVYRLDLLVEQRVIVEIKAVDRLAPVHQAQMLSYLRHTGLRVGLILNFNTAVLPDGIKRISL
ncbi:MAG TPA: GxxExxY protein [Gemmatimonadaceae bacterium]